MMIYGQKDRSVFCEILTIRVGVARKVRWCCKSRATRLYNPLCRSVRRSVRHTLLFFVFCALCPHCPCPNDEVAANMAPAHPHATWVAVYPALFVKGANHYDFVLS